MTHLPLPARDRKLLAQVRERYSTRKDVREIMNELESLITEKERYRSVFTSFIHGGCTKAHFDQMTSQVLTTNEARNLHNKLIQAIIYNAHFSTVPPPGIVIPPPKFLPEPGVKPYPQVKASHKSRFQTFTAADLRHIQSQKQLMNRVIVLLMHGGKLPVDDEAIENLQINVIRYTGLVLKRCLDRSGPKPITLRVKNILSAIKEDDLCGAVTSTLLLTKYQNAA